MVSIPQNAAAATRMIHELLLILTQKGQLTPDEMHRVHLAGADQQPGDDVIDGGNF